MPLFREMESSQHLSTCMHSCYVLGSQGRRGSTESCQKWLQNCLKVLHEYKQHMTSKQCNVITGSQTSRKTRSQGMRLAQRKPKRLQNTQGAGRAPGLPVLMSAWKGTVPVVGLGSRDSFLFSESHTRMIPLLGCTKHVPAHPSSLEEELRSYL